ncbi:MAG TPA: STAS domain-containing protein [bacterium]|nr:STAS domain-containing protein [bacterium]HPP86565.1 STAS domain-containing protein [bacterium]
MSPINIKSGLRVEDYVYKKIQVVEFTGSLTEQNLMPVREELVSKFPNFLEYVAFDMSKVPFISIDTLRELIELNKKLKMLNKVVFLIRLHKPVYKFLSTTPITTIFKILENEEQVFQTYLADKNLTEDDVEIFSAGNKLNKWYNKIQQLLLEIKEDSDPLLKNNFIPEDVNNNLTVVIVSRNIALGRSLIELAAKYKLTPVLSSFEQIMDVIGKADNLCGYIIDGYEELDHLSRVINKIRNTETDFCKSLLPILVSLKLKTLGIERIPKLNEMIYYIVDDSVDREAKSIKKIRNLYENIDKVVIYITPNIKFELTTEICTFYFYNVISPNDAEIFEAFVDDEFVANLLKDMFTINFNHYDCKEADSLFISVLHKLSETYEQSVHFMTKADTPLNKAIRELPIELNVNIL